MSAIKKLAIRLLPPAVTRVLKAHRRGRAATNQPLATSGDGDLGSCSLDDVRHFEDRLDYGYVEAATAALSHLLENVDVAPEVRTAAALSLARRELLQHRFSQALEHLDAVPNGTQFDRETASLAADCLVRLGDGRRSLARLSVLIDKGIATASTLIRVGSARSLIDRDRSYGSGWLVTELNRLYLDEGLAPISRRNIAAAPAFTNLTANSPPHRGQATLISVVVPTYNSGESVEASVESVLRQSWSHIEVIVVDEGSSDGTTEKLEKLSGADQRLRIAAPSTVEGTFGAINWGVEMARGDFIAIHGGADWSHPQRLEMQATALLTDPTASASGISVLAVGSDFLHRSPSQSPTEALIVRDLRSVMYRRSALDRIGLWDHAELAAEEHVRRLQTIFGNNSIVWLADDVPLTLRRVDDAPNASWTTYKSRYREAFRWWHANSRLETNLPYRPGEGPHPFAPWSLGLPDDDRQPSAVILGDLSRRNQVTAGLIDFADRHPGKIGIIHVPGFDRGSGGDALLPAIQQRVVSGALVDKAMAHSVTTSVLLLTDSAVASPQVAGLPSIAAAEAYMLDDGQTTDVTARAWAGIPLKGIVDARRLDEVLLPI